MRAKDTAGDLEALRAYRSRWVCSAISRSRSATGLSHHRTALNSLPSQRPPCLARPTIWIASKMHALSEGARGHDAASPAFQTEISLFFKSNSGKIDKSASPAVPKVRAGKRVGCALVGWPAYPHHHHGGCREQNKPALNRHPRLSIIAPRRAMQRASVSRSHFAAVAAVASLQVRQAEQMPRPDPPDSVCGNSS